jgi:LEA14-like dessication related protein
MRPVSAPVPLPLAWLGAALVVLAGCASLAPKIEAPRVSLEAVRVARIVDARAEVSLKLRLTNPNDTELALKALEYEVKLDGREAATGRTTRVEPLPAGGEGAVEISGQVDVAAVATAMMALGSQLPVSYAIKGIATLQNGLTLPFSRKGEIAISRFEPR